MGIKVNTKGVEVNEAIYINKTGNFLLKIEKIEEDGMTQEGAVKFKVHFKGMEVGNKDIIYLHTERFNLQQNSLWRIKQLEIAMKAPESYDMDDFIGRYVLVTIKARNYNKNDGTQGTAYEVSTWAYAKQNDKLPPIPEDESDTNDGGAELVEEAIEILDSECPF
jgi:hypothetical protein